MRRTSDSWTTVFSKLRFRRRTAKRRPVQGRLLRVEPLEGRHLLSVSTASTGHSAFNEFSVAALAPSDYEVGHFALNSDEWSGKSVRGRLRHDGSGLGVDSRDVENDPNRFDPGESWSFHFGQDGILLGIQFNEFTVDDADKASLTIGDSEPIVISAKELIRGFWRPSKPLKFEVDEVFVLTALTPNAQDLEDADAELEVRETSPLSRWRITGVQVVGRTDSTHGGYLDLAHKPISEFENSQQLVGPSISLSSMQSVDAGPIREQRRPQPTVHRGPSSGMFETSMAYGYDIAATGFSVSGSDKTKLVVDYDMAEGDATELGTFPVKIYRSLNGTNPIGQALMTKNVSLSSNSGSIEIDVDFADIAEDYYLLAKFEVGDDNDANNTFRFAGGLFVDPTRDVVHLHGAYGYYSDDISIYSHSNGTNYVEWNSQTVYSSSSPFEIHVRAHGGNDDIVLEDSEEVGLKLWAFGGNDNDNITGADESDLLFGGMGYDTIYGGGGDDYIRADDSEYGYGPGDYLFGEDGDDEIHGGGNADWIDGGDGADTIYGGHEQAQTPTAEWDSYGYGGGGYFDDGGGDYILAGAGNDHVEGGAGNDFIQGISGENSLDGGDDDDFLIGGWGADFIDAGAGNDLVWDFGGNNVILGGAGADVIHGSAGADIIDGGGGNDTLNGQSGNDTYVISSSAASDVTINDVGGTDTVDFSSWAGTSGITIDLDYAAGQWQTVNAAHSVRLKLHTADILENVVGSELNDTIQGNELANRLDGYGGDDTLDGGTGNDTYAISSAVESDITILDGGGTDTVDFSQWDGASGIAFDLAFAEDEWQTVSFDYSVRVKLDDDDLLENVIGSAAADEIFGNEGNNVLDGGAGDDWLDGAGGDDTLLGGYGDDRYVIRVDAESDITIGDTAGVDTVDFFSWSGASGIEIDLGDAADQWQTVSSEDDVRLKFLAAEQLERVVGSPLDDVIQGNSLPNVLDGGAGDDEIHGGGGNDKLIGGAGVDTMSGGAGHDFYNTDGEDNTSAPTIDEIANVTTRIDQDIAFRVIVDDTEDLYQELSFSISIVDSESEPVLGGIYIIDGGVFHWTIDSEPGTYTATITVTDTDQNSTQEDFDIELVDYNFGPPAQQFVMYNGFPFNILSSGDTHLLSLFDERHQTDVADITVEFEEGEPASADLWRDPDDVFVDWYPPAPSPFFEGINYPQFQIVEEWFTPYRMIVSATDDGTPNNVHRSRQSVLYGPGVAGAFTFDRYHQESEHAQEDDIYVAWRDSVLARDDHFWVDVGGELVNESVSNSGPHSSDWAQGEEVSWILVGGAPPEAAEWAWNSNTGEFTYVPDPAFEGLVTFQYKIVEEDGWFEWHHDGNGNPLPNAEYETIESNVATVFIEVGKAVRANLTIEGLDEEDEEEGLGKFLAINTDDDNDNLVPDSLELVGPVKNENDLVRIAVDYWKRDDAFLTDFTAWFSAPEHIRLWTTSLKTKEIIPGAEFLLSELPDEVFAEGIEFGSGLVGLSIVGPHSALFTGMVTPPNGGAPTNDTDSVAVTVPKVDLEIWHANNWLIEPSVDGENPSGPGKNGAEWQIGAFTVVNWNDTDGDGRRDDQEPDDHAVIALTFELEADSGNVGHTELRVTDETDMEFLKIGDRVVVRKGQTDFELRTITDWDAEEKTITINQPLTKDLRGGTLGHPGQDEVDLMRLLVHHPIAAAQNETIALKVNGGNIRLWETSVRSGPVELTQGALEIPISSIPTEGKEFWVEVVSKSNSLQDIEIELKYRDVSDFVRATGIWVDEAQIEIKDDNAVDPWPELVADIDDPIHPSFMFLSEDGFHEVFGLDPLSGAPDEGKGFHNQMGIRFVVGPPGIEHFKYHSVVHFDIARRAEARLWDRQVGDPEFVEVQNDRTIMPLHTEELPNDDSSDQDESVVPDVRYRSMFQLDKPGIHTPVNGKEAVAKFNFDEWLRVTFGTRPDPSGDIVVGSRASEYIPWHARIHYIWDIAGARRVPDAGMETVSNDIEPGHIALTPP